MQRLSGCICIVDKNIMIDVFLLLLLLFNFLIFLIVCGSQINRVLSTVMYCCTENVTLGLVLMLITFVCMYSCNVYKTLITLWHVTYIMLEYIFFFSCQDGHRHSEFGSGSERCHSVSDRTVRGAGGSHVGWLAGDAVRGSNHTVWCGGRCS